MQRFQIEIDERMKANSQKLMACSFCDELYCLESMHETVVNSQWIKKLRTRLCGQSNEPDLIREYYDVSKMDDRLKVIRNVALSPRGVSASQDGSCPNLLFCVSCYSTLNNNYEDLILIPV